MSGLPAWRAQVDQSIGSQWVRCALQVNPYDYCERHGIDSGFEESAAYDDAVSQALLEAGVGVAVVTDHFRINESESLLAAIRAREIVALPGFEANTSEGVHLLIVFSENTPLDDVRHAIKSCELNNPAADSPISRLSATQLMAQMSQLDALCVAAHATLDSGVLKTLVGSARVQAWTSPNLVAAAIPGPVSDAPESVRRILLNEETAHQRDRALAVINAGDLSGPGDAANAGATVLLRMTAPGWRGLQHALADPDSRVRLNSDPEPPPRPVIRAIHWDGGYLDGQTIVLSEQLNVLVGAPGAGKSTVIESVRAAFGLEAHGGRAQEGFDGLAQAALANATISIVVEHPSPSPSRVVIRRTFPHPPEVLDWATFQPSGRRVEDLRPLPEVYGQHEIAELSQDEAKRTQVLERFVPADSTLDTKIDALGAKLVEVERHLELAEQAADDLAATAHLLPGIEEELSKWKELGIAAKLEQSTLVEREHRYLRRLEDFVGDLAQHLKSAAIAVGETPEFPQEIAGAPFEPQLIEARDHAAKARAAVVAELDAGSAAVREQLSALAAVRVAYKVRRASVEGELTEVRKSLGPNVSSAEFSELQRRGDLAREAARTLPEQKAAVAALEGERRSALLAREEATAERTRKLEKAANKVNAQLKRVRVHVRSAPDLDAFREFASEHLKGFRSQSHQALAAVANLSFRGLAQACREGDAATKAMVAMAPSDVHRMTSLEPQGLRALEALGPRTTTQIELDVSLTGTPIWRRIEDLSRGQKATAVLLLLLLPTEAPLLVDQPEDDLDNRFIVKSVVPAVRETKANRQYLFATHNANVPVLADAELIAGLTPADAAGSAGHAVVRPEHCGSLDRETVRDLVERQLEGGRDAFDERRRRYGR